jgi:hypothetical protein
VVDGLVPLIAGCCFYERKISDTFGSSLDTSENAVKMLLLELCPILHDEANTKHCKLLSKMQYRVTWSTDSRSVSLKFCVSYILI